MGMEAEAWLQRSFFYSAGDKGVGYTTPCKRVITSAGIMPTIKEAATSPLSLLPNNNNDDEVLLQDLKAGQALSARVKRVTSYAAFIDCRVKRKGKGGHLVPVMGFLHISDVPEGIAFLQRGARHDNVANDVKTYITEGASICVYAKDIFKQQGRLTLTLYPDIDRNIVSKDRREKRYSSTIFRRTLRPSTSRGLSDFSIGALVNGVVMRKSEKGVLVDVGAPRYAKLPMGAISRAMGGKYVEMKDLPRPGTRVLCNVTDSWLDDTKMLSVRLGLVEVAEFPTRRSACGEMLVDRQQYQQHITSSNRNCKTEIEAGSNGQAVIKQEEGWRDNNIPGIETKVLKDCNNRVINKRKNPHHVKGVSNDIVTIDCTGLNNEEKEEFDEKKLCKSLKKKKLKIILT